MNSTTSVIPSELYPDTEVCATHVKPAGDTHPAWGSEWSRRYGEKYKFTPILDNPHLPNSRRGQVKVYRRGPHTGPGPHDFVLEWREGGKAHKYTVRGDLFKAVAEADKLDERLVAAGRSGKGCGSIMIPELIRRFLEHLSQRANAREIRGRTVDRYRTALQKLIDFVEGDRGRARTRAASIEVEFVLEFKSYLFSLLVHPNGHEHSEPKPMTKSGARFVLSAAKAAWAWASSQNRPLLPEGLRNPFNGHVPPRARRELVTKEKFPTKDIVRAVEVCDDYQLTTLAPLVLYGLRAAEPRYIMIEHWNRAEDNLEVNCIPGLDYFTTGEANKRFPVPGILKPLLQLISAHREGGPLFVCRAMFQGMAEPRFRPLAESALIREYRRRTAGLSEAVERAKMREHLMTEAGAVTYDQLDAEFRQIAKAAGLGPEWTLKGLRHHFASQMEKSSISYFSRKYVMGHQIPADALGNYTTIPFEDVRAQFEEFLSTRLAPIVQAIQARATALGLQV
jgi:site-specific recombinase XerD